MMRYESGKKFESKQKFDDQESSEEKNLSFNYYIEQLHQISIEQKSVRTEQRISVDIDDDDLDVFVQIIRLLWETNENFLDAFFVEAEHRLGLDMKKTYPALLRMQAAGLVTISEGKVFLTDSGKELMEEM